MWGASFKSYNATTMAATAVITRFAEKDNRQFQVGSSAIMVDRGFRAPAYATQSRKERYITMTAKVLDTANIKTLTDTLLDVFDTADDNLRTLIVTDTASVDWQVSAKVTGHVADGAIHKITFAAPDGIWVASTATTAALWSATATAATNDYTVTGTHPVKPTIVVTPVVVRSGAGFAYRRFVTIYNNLDIDFIDYPVNVVGTTLDTDALVTAAKMQADGDDLRVYVDGKQVARWLQGINTVNTKVWCNIDLAPKQTMVLEGAVSADNSSLVFESTKATRLALKKLPDRGTLLLESELVTYTAVDVLGYQVTGVTRGVKETTVAAHADAVVVRWIEHEIWFCYGNSGLAAPTQSDKTKPMIALTSTNTSWDFDDFLAHEAIGATGTDPTSKRTAQWSPALTKTTGGLSEYYTGSRGAHVTPATEMGIYAQSWQQGSQWRSEEYAGNWSIYIPAGVTDVTLFDGESYTAATADWGTKALLQVSTTGGKNVEWVDTALVVAAPASAATWTAFSTSGALGATYYFLRTLFKGSLGAVSGKKVYLEVENVTLTLASGGVPTVSLGAEKPNTCQLEFILENTTTGEKFSVDYPILLADYITIDCENKTIRAKDGTNIFPALTLETAQNEWMTMIPGVNVIKITETGMVGNDIDISWSARDGGF
jgi:hypothetical protein